MSWSLVAAADLTPGDLIARDEDGLPVVMRVQSVERVWITDEIEVICDETAYLYGPAELVRSI